MNEYDREQYRKYLAAMNSVELMTETETVLAQSNKPIDSSSHPVCTMMGMIQGDWRRRKLEWVYSYLYANNAEKFGIEREMI